MCSKKRKTYKSITLRVVMLDFNNLERQIQERGSIETLDNGITLITENVSGSGLARGNITIFAGAGYEKPEDYGLVHFLEHMTFEGSRLFPDKEVQYKRAGALGIQLDANTSCYSVNYSIKGSNSSGYLLKSNFLEGLEITTDLAFFPRLAEKDLALVRQIIQVERVDGDIQRLASKYALINDQLSSKLYGKNLGFLRRPLGTKDSIDGITIEKLKESHSRNFVGSNALAILGGDIKDQRRDIKKILSIIPMGEQLKPLEIYEEDEFGRRERLEFDSPNKDKTEVYIYFKIPPQHSIDSESIDLLCSILGKGMNSLLFKEMRDKRGLVYSIRSHLERIHDKSGLLRINYSVNPGCLDESLRIVDECLDRVRNSDFDDSLIEIYRAAYLPDLLDRFQRPGWIGAELRERFDKDRFGKDSTYLERIKHLSFDKQVVVDLARKYLGENRLLVLLK